MTNISRYEPFDPYEDLFKGLVLRPMRFEMPAQPLRAKMDISETQQAYTLKAEIPGVKKEDIHVSIDGSQVSISAEMNQEKEQKEGEKIIHSERVYGKIQRSVTLGQDIDETAASAKYTDGVLYLTLPKKAASTTRKLAVE